MDGRRCVYNVQIEMGMKYFKVKMPEAYARVEWCKKMFGRPFQDLPNEQRKWNNMRWYRNKGYLYFREEKDYIWYQLTWSEISNDVLG